MKRYDYLIVGGGMAADAAARGIREIDQAGSIGLLGDEPDPPYARPPLSKGLWKGRPIEKIWRNTAALEVDLQLSTAAAEVDVRGKRVLDAHGDEHGYGQLMIATGGTPRRLPSVGEDVLYYRRLSDYRRLRELAATREKFLAIGGSFIGSELAAALAGAGRRVTMLFPEDGIGGSMFPAELSAFLNDYYREHGVELLPGQTAERIDQTGNRIVTRTKAGKVIESEAAVAGIGIEPNVALARAAELEVRDGIVVNENLRTSAPDIYAAGDVAQFHHAALGESVRVEHEDNALAMGRMAGRNMAGAGERYTHTPMFYSDLFDLGYEAVGQTNSRMATVSDWQDGCRKGVVYYLADGRVRGVLLWNVWKKVDAARALMAEPGPWTEKDLKGRISD